MPVMRVGALGDRAFQRALGGLHMKNEDGLLQSTLEPKLRIGLLQTIEHELRPMGPTLVPLLATKCLYLGDIEGCI